MRGVEPYVPYQITGSTDLTRLGTWWYECASQDVDESRPRGPFRTREEAIAEIREGKAAMSDDYQVEPSPSQPIEEAVIVIWGWHKAFIPWDEIPDLITKLRRAYNSRPTERQEK